VIVVGGDLKAPLAFGANAVLLYELLHPLLAHRDTACHQLAPGARPAAGATGFAMQRLDVHQQRIVA
jgi:hypothetical protein